MKIITRKSLTYFSIIMNMFTAAVMSALAAIHAAVCSSSSNIIMLIFIRTLCAQTDLNSLLLLRRNAGGALVLKTDTISHAPWIMRKRYKSCGDIENLTGVYSSMRKTAWWLSFWRDNET